VPRHTKFEWIRYTWRVQSHFIVIPNVQNIKGIAKQHPIFVIWILISDSEMLVSKAEPWPWPFDFCGPYPPCWLDSYFIIVAGDFPAGKSRFVLPSSSGQPFWLQGPRSGVRWGVGTTNTGAVIVCPRFMGDLSAKNREKIEKWWEMGMRNTTHWLNENIVYSHQQKRRDIGI
jgi:hypothetical protein